MTITSKSVEETRAAGASLAAITQGGEVYALEGELGSGKTEFVRGFVFTLADTAVVRSPTFSIVNIYQTGSFPIYHFDFYRLTNPSELDEIGFQEYAAGDGVCLIEWGTMFPKALPASTKIIRFTDEGGSIRKIEMPD
jgi:tRNA threonylcarbamoyladenosine biosynthesis protein TsaE